MFDVSKRISTNDTDDNAGQSVGGTLLERLADTEGRIYLPRGSAQSRFEPRSYYYPASESGAVPKWVADEAWRKRTRRVN